MNRQYGALSGVAIVLIVLNHAVEFGLQVSPVSGSWLNILQFLQALGVFAVPAFLFISGAFLAYAARELSFSFVRRSLDRILWPYAIWSVVFYVMMSWASGMWSSPLAYIKNLLVGYPFHFVPLLVFWYLAAPVVARIGKKHGVVLLLAIGLFQFLLIVLRFPRAFSAFGTVPAWMRMLEPPVLFTTLADWAIYFPLGLVFGIHDAALKPRLRKLKWVAVAATVGLFVLTGLHGMRIVSAPLARLVVPLPLMLLLPVINRQWLPWVSRLEMLGRRSYAIYLGHFVVINLLVLIATSGTLNLSSLPVVVFPLFFIVALGTPVLVMNLMTKVPPARRVYRYLFGIVPPAAEMPRPLSAHGSR